MASPAHITFFVEGSPPKKDGASSMWNKDSELPKLKALRIAAHHAMAGRPPFTQSVGLTITIYGNPTGADLDNLIGGVCDGLQAGWVRRDDPRWLDVPERAHPQHPIVFTDDSIIVSILAKRAQSPARQNGYEVTIVGN